MERPEDRPSDQVIQPVTSIRRSLDDENYHHRFPGCDNLNVHPKMVFRGHNFQIRKLKPLRSFAYGDTKEPELPQPWVKSPRLYPPEVEEDYIEYKSFCGDHVKVKEAYDNAIFDMRTGEDMMRGEQAATDLIMAANRAGAARAGFLHKYPTAYEDHEATKDHEKAATNLINSAKKARKKRNKLRRDILNRLFPFARWFRHLLA
ncbi:hypothetical protein ASPBRDRAFT_27451 [Aspergillus brasiliensis CBS 101740]|uniref:Uncharacterized protein n=1 Tax=Aspergillus brasiliensis (strain CBS 101740 / IMI 381727 / IBT 21946) TaxID=767769 RepID=A0A1L9US17_ASPBC|nr:hypothetical protein ASPBRDRAFT_27451 [Aspergillus brasiliensis CBS 101740]